MTGCIDKLVIDNSSSIAQEITTPIQNIVLNNQEVQFKQLSSPVMLIGNCFLQEKPFVFVKQSKAGKKTYTGLCIDLLDKLKEEMKFRYTIEESPDNVYGAPDVFTGEWSGMVRYLIDNVSAMIFHTGRFSKRALITIH